MRAIVISENGGPDVLQIRELPDPVPGEGDVLIRVRAFGVNHAETHMRKGEWAEAAQVSGNEGRSGKFFASGGHGPLPSFS